MRPCSQTWHKATAVGDTTKAYFDMGTILSAQMLSSCHSCLPLAVLFPKDSSFPGQSAGCEWAFSLGTRFPSSLSRNKLRLAPVMACE